MVRTVTSETPAVAQRLSDLILCFPSVVAGGVQWQTLVRKYNDRHSSTLDIAALGHSSPLSAATTLLFDVLRLVDAEDTDNPVLAVEDGVAMVPQPGTPATWPSLYQSMCTIIREHGSQQESSEGEEVHAMLVSQLKPLLQRHWHNSFDECSLSYLTEEGTPVRVKKMKHLLQALLRWRDERVAWKVATRGCLSALDTALEAQLELVPSKTHNDLLLRCVQHRPCTPLVYAPTLWAFQQTAFEQEVHDATPKSSLHGSEDLESVPGSSCGSADLAYELAMLRAENARLRNKNSSLQHESENAMLKKALFEAELMVDVLDDPSEPPPFEYRGKIPSSCGSTAPSDFGFRSGAATPLSAGSESMCSSGAVTPTAFPVHGQTGHVCTMVPMWFALGDRLGIPSGVVQQARAVFECHKTLPSQLLNPAMSCPGEVRMC